MRDCKNCVHNTPDGCESWDCEYINRAEAIECYEIVKAMKDMGETYGKVKAVNVEAKI